MTSAEFIAANYGNANGKVKFNSSIMKAPNGWIYSYGYHYPLLFHVGGLDFRNVAGYSATTGKHIRWAGGLVDTIDIKLGQAAIDTLNSSFKSDNDKLLELLHCLEFEAESIRDKLAGKKRTDTQVYRRLSYDLTYLAAAIKEVDAKISYL